MNFSQCCDRVDPRSFNCVEHDESSDCWCAPILIYTDPITGSRVWQHRDAETAH